MAGTYTSLQYHIVLSTKGRRRYLTDEIRPRLYEYMGGTIRKQDGTLYAAGGTDDHVHLLVRWRPSGALSDLVRDIKSGSSGWLHRDFHDMALFRWQDGFGAFSVSHSQSEKVKRYIRDQALHHRETDFKGEFRALLKAHGIEFDEEQIWR